MLVARKSFFATLISGIAIGCVVAFAFQSGQSEDGRSETSPSTVGQRDLGVEAPVEGLPVELEELQVDLGVHQLGSAPRGNIAFRVKGDRPLTLLAASPTCSCLSTDFNGRVEIAPGARHVVQVEFRERSFPGTAEERVRLVFAGSKEILEVPVRAFFSRAIEVSPEYINAESVLKGEMTLRSLDDVPFEVLSVSGNRPLFVGEQSGAATQHALQWDLRAFENQCTDEFGARMPKWLVVETNHPLAPFVDVRVRNSSCTKLDVPLSPDQEWYLGEHRFILGAIGSGGAKDFVLPIRYFKGAKRLEAVSLVSSGDPRFGLEVVKIIQQFDQRDIYLQLSVPEGMEPGFYQVPLVVRSSESAARQECVAFVAVR